MKTWRKIFFAALGLVLLNFILVNLLFNSRGSLKGGRPYRVEIERAAQKIAENGFPSLDLSQYEYIDCIVEYHGDFYNSNSDYVIREIGGILYRFDYTFPKGQQGIDGLAVVYAILAEMAVLILWLFLYIRKEILRPFERLSDLPYELAKGNFTAPIKESKSRFFGKFLWGVDLLRENMEEQKQRELALMKEKKTLLLSLSHDIKTPLSAIKLYAKALERNLYPDAEKQRQTAENICGKADEIGSYVSQIIAASREDFLSFHVENGEFYLSDLVKNIAGYYSEKMALAKVDFTIGEYADCLLLGDLDRGVEVLQNIIENAAKYGGGCIEVFFPCEEEGVLVSVKSNGCTLAKEELPHIFESFWRGKNAQNVKGSGLGLYICRQLMHRMNGEVFVEMEGEEIVVTVVFARV